MFNEFKADDMAQYFSTKQNVIYKNNFIKEIDANEESKTQSNPFQSPDQKSVIEVNKVIDK
jgi:hypothetical protein